MNIKSRKLLSIFLTLALVVGLSAAFLGPAKAALPTPVRPMPPMERPAIGSGTKIAAGGAHTVGLKADGTVVAVGFNDYGQCNVSGWTNIVAVAAGIDHTVGLKANGTVVDVGYDSNGELDVSGWTDIVAVSAGYEHTVGLKADGTVLAVGAVDTPFDFGQMNVSGWTDIVAVAAGYFHTVGLKADGTVLAVGRNINGQINVSEWTDIVAVAAGWGHTVGLKADGTVLAVGWDDDGQLDVSGWTDIVAVAAGDNHTVGLKADGTVVAVGENSYNQCDTQSWRLFPNSPYIEFNEDLQRISGTLFRISVLANESLNLYARALPGGSSAPTAGDITEGILIGTGTFHGEVPIPNSLGAVDIYIVGESATIPGLFSNILKESFAAETIINIAAISGVPVPVPGATPVTKITETAQYTGTVEWSIVGSSETFTTFGYSTEYRATITLTPKSGYTLIGVSSNFFTVAGASSRPRNLANSGVITATFPATGSKPNTGSGDVNGDGKVDATDLSMLISDFGKTTGYNPGSDINGDKKVDATDLSILISNFGKS